MKEISEFLIGVITLAVIFVLVRPGSQGPGFVSATGTALTGLITAATGGGTWANA